MISALKVVPEQADDAQIEAVSFVLNTVLPAVEPRVNQTGSWLKEKSTVKILGDTWHVEMATCYVVLVHYSNPDNLLYNAGKVGSDTSEGSETDNSSDKPADQPPQKKRRRRLHNKEGKEIVVQSYYNTCKLLKEIMEGDGFQQRMDAWDRHCLKKRRGDSGAGPEQRENTVPLEHQCASFDDHDYLGDFLGSQELHAPAMLGGRKAPTTPPAHVAVTAV